MNESETAGPPPAVGPGRMLSLLREERGFSVSDVAQRLKYAAKQIEALEAEEFQKLPGSTFVRGMVRNYARLLDTDPQPVLGALDRQYAPGEISLDLRHKGVPFVRSGKRGTRIYLAMSFLLLIVAAAAYEWRAGALPWAKWLPKAVTAPSVQTVSRAVPPAAPVAPAAPAVPAAPAAPAEVHAPAVQTPPVPARPPAEPVASPPPAKEGRIALEFEGESWVEIKDQEGKMLMSQLNSAGSRKVVVGHPPMSLVIGNASAVRLNYNGAAVDLKPYIQIEVARLTLE